MCITTYVWYEMKERFSASVAETVTYHGLSGMNGKPALSLLNCYFTFSLSGLARLGNLSRRIFIY